MKELPYHLGIIIPCFLIFCGGLLTYEYVLYRDSPASKSAFMLLWLMVSTSYAMAVNTPPGAVDASLCGQKGALDGYCFKCKKPKPERAHHCKKCGYCVLRMDHHCPWTESCVGFGNFLPFFRFLWWVVVGTGYCLYRALGWCYEIYQNYDHPATLTKWHVGMVLVDVALLALVFLTVGILFLRVCANIWEGKTQIEDWEIDRVNTMAHRKLAAHEDFPFDLGPYENFIEFFGSPWAWILPWALSPNDGHKFTKAFPTKRRWPPEAPINRRHIFYRQDNWISPDGELLEDFGVDVSTEIPTSQLLEDDDAPLR